MFSWIGRSVGNNSKRKTNRAKNKKLWKLETQALKGHWKRRYSFFFRKLKSGIQQRFKSIDPVRFHSWNFYCLPRRGLELRIHRKQTACTRSMRTKGELALPLLKERQGIILNVLNLVPYSKERCWKKTISLFSVRYKIFQTVHEFSLVDKWKMEVQ